MDGTCKGIVFKGDKSEKDEMLYDLAHLSQMWSKKLTEKEITFRCYQRQRMIKGIGRVVVKMYSFQSSGSLSTRM